MSGGREDQRTEPDDEAETDDQPEPYPAPLRRHEAGLRRLAENQEQRREGRHDVVRQLGHVETEENVRADEPGDEERVLLRPVAAEDGDAVAREREPREQADDGDHHIIEEERRVPVERVPATLEDVGVHANRPVLAVGLDESRDAPRADQRERNRQAEPDTQTAPWHFLPPQDPAERQEAEQRDDHDHGALGKEADTAGEVEQPEPAPRILFAFRMEQLEGGVLGERGHGDHRHIGDGAAAVHQHLETGQQAERGEESRAERKPAPAHFQDNPEQQDRGEDGRQSCGKFIAAEDSVNRPHHPVDQDRLVEAVVVIEVRHHPFVALHHLAGGLGEAWLVAIDQWNQVVAGKQDEQRRDRQEEERQRPSLFRLQLRGAIHGPGY